MSDKFTILLGVGQLWLK